MDILKKYNKHKKMSNLSIVIISLVIAFGINFFVINNTDLSSNLKTSLLESEMQNNNSDIYFKNNNNDLVLKTNKNISNIENLALSIVYNPENLEIKEIIPKLNAEIINDSNTPGISTILVEYSEINNIKAGEKILTVKTEKKENITENINILNANFTDSNSNTYELSSSSITF